MRSTRSAQPADPGLVLIPIALLAHNAEEALTIRGALPRLTELAHRVAGSEATLPTVIQYHAALVIVTMLAFAVYSVSRSWHPLRYGLVVLQAVMALNVITHSIAALMLWGYVPGLITAWSVEAPTSWLVYRRIRDAGLLTRTQWRLLFPLGLLLHGPGLYALLQLARGPGRG